MADTLAMRAARFYGAEDKPRASIPGPSGVVVLIWDDGGRKHLGVYAESHFPTGCTVVSLTEQKRRTLAEALNA